MHNGASQADIKDYMKKNDLGDMIGSDMESVLTFCTTQADIYNNYQLGTKVVINGIYGAFGFAGFYFYNKHIAVVACLADRQGFAVPEFSVNYIVSTNIGGLGRSQKDDKHNIGKR